MARAVLIGDESQAASEVSPIAAVALGAGGTTCKVALAMAAICKGRLRLHHISRARARARDREWQHPPISNHQIGWVSAHATADVDLKLLGENGERRSRRACFARCTRVVGFARCARLVGCARLSVDASRGARVFPAMTCGTTAAT